MYPSNRPIGLYGERDPMVRIAGAYRLELEGDHKGEEDRRIFIPLERSLEMFDLLHNAGSRIPHEGLG